jgi:hypothetical protein
LNKISESVFIYGGGGHGKVVLDIVRAAFGPEALAGIFDDDPQKEGTSFYYCTITGSLENGFRYFVQRVTWFYSRNDKNDLVKMRRNWYLLAMRDIWIKPLLQVEVLSCNKIFSLESLLPFKRAAGCCP